MTGGGASSGRFGWRKSGERKVNAIHFRIQKCGKVRVVNLFSENLAWVYVQNGLVAKGEVAVHGGTLQETEGGCVNGVRM